MSQNDEERQIDGACHCGGIRFQFLWPGPPGPIPVRACGCSFCVKHGGVYTSHPQGRLTVTLAKPDQVKAYRFGTRTAIFHVCRSCGVVPYVTSEIDGRLHAVVNVNCFEGLAPEDLARSASDFEGEDVASRLARRARTWIGDVRYA